MIYSVKIIDGAGLTLIDRHYVGPTGDETLDPNLVSGMLTALAQFCEHLIQNDIQTITLGNSQFFLLKHRDLLFTMHTNLKHSKYLSLVKLQRIKESFAEFNTTNPLMQGNEIVYRNYIPILDEILRDRSPIELEILIDYFLTGKGIVGTYIHDLQQNVEVLSRCPLEWQHRLTEYVNLFEISFSYIEQVLPQSTNRTEKYAIFQAGISWLIGIKQQSLLLVALFQGELDHNLITDIIHGTLGDVLQFIAEYFQEVFM